MRYIFLIYSQETASDPPREEAQELIRQHSVIMDETTQKGILLAASGLKPSSTATTVRKKSGKTITIDGPFAETKEQLAGYYIIECRDLDEAIDWAKRIPTSCKEAEGCIEIRPIADLRRRG